MVIAQIFMNIVLGRLWIAILILYIIISALDSIYN